MKKVLVIDDNKEFVELIEYTLSKEYEVLKCYSLEDIRCIEQDKTFDIILSDYNLGLDQGDAIVDTLKSVLDISETKLILISGSTDLKAVYKDLGMHDYLEKPFKMKELKQKINDLTT